METLAGKTTGRGRGCFTIMKGEEYNVENECRIISYIKIFSTNHSINLSEYFCEGVLSASSADVSMKKVFSLSAKPLDSPVGTSLKWRISALSSPHEHYNDVMTGEIPKEISNLVELEELDLANNSFSGRLDTEIFNISGLRIIDSFNNLSESLPPILGSILPNIEELYLNNLNNLVGTIPQSISNYSKLTRLELSNNQFTRLIPNSLGSLTHLKLI
ncbi:LRR receptor-like serine/threonine-protein kinase RGI1 [Capsicum annuum]|uniref:LRR receptor-like serine/threonine-protein kinase RGI1 n=1 Tax=Capsicum annuum TaxID=4072 RepID=UPI0007BF6AF0|nr:LRR receptor-like serine/threonine-protein kinase RGI1 [Capsicum annuum]